MNKPKIKTLKELKKTNYKSESIKVELARNLKKLIASGKSSFIGIYGYENTVIPDLERSILSGHNINFLGLRGQAKTRLARQMVDLLYEWIPKIKDSEINNKFPFSNNFSELGGYFKVFSKKLNSSFTINAGKLLENFITDDGEK